MAPELYEKGDVFSFALILYEIVVGRSVFSRDRSLPQLALKLAKGERADIPDTVEPFVAGLIHQGWSSDPTERSSFSEIFEELRSHAFCVARDGFNRADVESYVKWIETELCLWVQFVQRVRQASKIH
jgi:hypothetical protein